MRRDWTGHYTWQDAAILHVLRCDRFDPVATVALTHGVDRIEAPGSHATVIGSAGNDLVFSAIELDVTPSVAHSYIHEDASQGETRSHGFFFHPNGDGTGLLGLPVRRDGAPWQHLRYGSAEVVFLDVSRNLRLSPLGSLVAHGEGAAEDNCLVSCVDW